MAKEKFLFLEDAVLDDLAHDLDYLELPISNRAFRLIGMVVFLVAAVVLSDVLYLGWFKGDFYSEKALINASEMTTVSAERGIILDHYGKSLSDNLPAFSLNIKLAELLKDENMRKQTAQALESILNLPQGYIDGLLTNVNLEKQNSLTISKELTIDQVIKIKNANLQGVEIINDFKRQYPDGNIFSHIVGYTGLVNKDDLAGDSSLALNETIGKMGLEAYYDEELKGQDGETLNYRNVKGEIIGQKLLTKPVAGAEIYTTIDAGLQTYFYNSLKAGLARVGSKSGAGLIMNPDTGEILSLVSLPSYDNNKIQSQDLVDPGKPLFNRITSGVYSPGSTIKPLDAFAILKEGIISPDKKIYSPGYIELPNPYDPEHPSRFLDWQPQGWVDIYSALARSSDVYFYEVTGGYENQKGLGIEKLKQYWQEFGLDKPTGVDLPFENKGFLPDPDTKEKSNRGIWRIGDTYNVAIGQGDLGITPIELLNYISTIANNGKLLKPFLVQKVVGADGNLIKENKPQVVQDFSANSQIIKIIQQGMIDGVQKPYGTANTLSDLPFAVAAKTGTAQIQNNAKQNAFFVGYTIGNPSVPKSRIAILVLVENAVEGSLNAVPVAKDVLRWYYENRIQNNTSSTQPS